MFARIGRTATLALGFIGLGFLFIFLAWNGAASVDCAQCQIPYLISGGAAGLGFIGLGVGLLIFEAGRRHMARMEEKFDALIEAANGAAAVTASDDTQARADAPLVTDDMSGLVVIGRASFHRPDCRLVQGKEDLDFAEPDEAASRGLNPCRVCDPTHAFSN